MKLKKPYLRQLVFCVRVRGRKELQVEMYAQVNSTLMSAINIRWWLAILQQVCRGGTATTSRSVARLVLITTRFSIIWKKLSVRQKHEISASVRIKRLLWFKRDFSDAQGRQLIDPLFLFLYSFIMEVSIV